MQYVTGTMFAEGKLLAVEKLYYKRTKEGFGYVLARDTIAGVAIDAEAT
jgi:hypothetical protein